MQKADHQGVLERFACYQAEILAKVEESLRTSLQKNTFWNSFLDGFTMRGLFEPLTITGLPDLPEQLFYPSKPFQSSSEPAKSDRLGLDKIGRYEVVDVIGRGGMGEVWTDLEFNVGDERIHIDLTKGDEELRDRFVQMDDGSLDRIRQAVEAAEEQHRQ